MWIFAVYRFDLSKRLVGLILPPHHGACRNAVRNIAQAFEISPLLVCDLPLDQFKPQIAAQYGAAFRLDAVRDAIPDRIDRADGGNAKRDAGEEDAETGEAAAHFAQRKSQGQL
jgi:hypothetical protein